MKLKPIAYGLIGVGALFLLMQSNILQALPALLWLSSLFVAGAAFWLGSLRRLPLPTRIAGFTGIGVVAVVTFSSDFHATAALGFPALAFLLVYVLNPRRWWAIMPGGILASVALLVTFEALFPRWDTTPILFLGFAATFTYLYLLSSQRGGKRWALYPAILFIILTVLVNDPSGQLQGWFLPLVLIGGGVLMLWWWRKQSR